MKVTSSNTCSGHYPDVLDEAVGRRWGLTYLSGNNSSWLELFKLIESLSSRVRKGFCGFKGPTALDLRGFEPSQFLAAPIDSFLFTGALSTALLDRDDTNNPETVQCTH